MFWVKKPPNGSIRRGAVCQSNFYLFLQSTLRYMQCLHALRNLLCGYKYPTMLMGVVAPGSAYARPSARPTHQHEQKICQRPCLQSHLQTSSPTPQKSDSKCQFVLKYSKTSRVKCELTLFHQTKCRKLPP